MEQRQLLFTLLTNEGQETNRVWLKRTLVMNDHKKQFRRTIFTITSGWWKFHRGIDRGCQLSKVNFPCKTVVAVTDRNINQLPNLVFKINIVCYFCVLF